jgi:DNA-binding transcriptional LysR family regulator
MQFALRDVLPDFLVRFPKVNVFAHATDLNVDIVGENFDIAVRAHSDPLPDSTLVQRPLAPAPWYLFAGAAYLDANDAPKAPRDLKKHPSLFMVRAGMPTSWRLRHCSANKEEVVIPLTPRLMGDDMIGLKQAAIRGLGVVALPGYVCREEIASGILRRVLPAWHAGNSTLTALIPYRHGLLPSVRALVEHLASEFPKVVLL